MKGATAEPWPKITSAPNRANKTRIGSNQNFFRVRRKAQSSIRNVTLFSSLERLIETIGRGARWAALDPIAGRPRWPLEPQGILAHQSHDGSARRQRPEKQQPHDERRRHLVQKVAEASPQSVQGREDTGCKKGGKTEGRGKRQRPPSHMCAMAKRQQPD